ncbi:hypothetical protein H0H87_009033, partial [Tephrocybe sp. NHM501043]
DELFARTPRRGRSGRSGSSSSHSGSSSNGATGLAEGLVDVAEFVGTAASSAAPMLMVRDFDVADDAFFARREINELD